MKNAILVLFLCAATSGMCQSPAAAPLGALKLGQAPPTITQPWMNFGNLRSGNQMDSSMLPRIIVPPKMTAPRHWDDAQIDPKIITHPSQSRLGLQLPGTQVARNEYPNLLMLPVDSPSVKLQATPTQWPDFALKSIPTRWPKVKLSPVHGDPQAIPTAPAK